MGETEINWCWARTHWLQGEADDSIVIQSGRKANGLLSYARVKKYTHKNDTNTAAKRLPTQHAVSRAWPVKVEGHRLPREATYISTRSTRIPQGSVHSSRLVWRPQSEGETRLRHFTDNVMDNTSRTTHHRQFIQTASSNNYKDTGLAILTLPINRLIIISLYYSFLRVGWVGVCGWEVGGGGGRWGKVTKDEQIARPGREQNGAKHWKKEKSSQENRLGRHGEFFSQWRLAERYTDHTPQGTDDMELVTKQQTIHGQHADKLRGNVKLVLPLFSSVQLRLHTSNSRFRSAKFIVIYKHRSA